AACASTLTTRACAFSIRADGFVFRRGTKICVEIGRGDDAILLLIGCNGQEGFFRVGAVPLVVLEETAKWRGRQVVRQRSAKPLSAVRFRPAPPIFPTAPAICSLRLMRVPPK